MTVGEIDEASYWINYGKKKEGSKKKEKERIEQLVLGYVEGSSTGAYVEYGIE